MNRRILTESQARWLENELHHWQDQQIVTTQQAQKIQDCYETPEELSSRKNAHFIFALLGIAGLMVALSLFLLVGYNWQEIPRLGKLAVIFSVIGITYAAGLYVHLVRKATIGAEILYFLASLFYGAGIFLTAQVYHLDAHYPDGFWWWAVGILPLTLCLQKPLLHCLYVSLLAIWAGMELITFSHLPHSHWGSWVIPNGAYSLLPMAALGLFWSYRRGSGFTTFIYLLLLSWWVALECMAQNVDDNAPMILGAFGALLLIFQSLHDPENQQARSYRRIGVFLSAGSLIPLGFGAYYQTSHSFDRNYAAVAGKTLMAFIVITLIGMVALSIHRRYRRSPVKKLGFPAGLLGAFALLAFWPSLCEKNTNELIKWTLPTVIANMAIIFMALWLMREGIRNDRGRSFALGVLYFLLWAACRYSDLFGNQFGMLGASLMFFLCGAGIFALGIFWRKRKALKLEHLISNG